MAEYTDEMRADILKKYLAANPTPENSTEIVKEIAEEYEVTPNGIRAILQKTGKYVKKAEAVKAKAPGDKPASGKGSKTVAMTELKTVIEANGLNYDAEIIGKLTGKAAVYFTEILKELANKEA